jgi:hypothetical protein
MLELQVAFVLFALALAALCPLVVMQSRQVRQLEKRLDPQMTYYLAPASDAWARKLGAAALVQARDPGPQPPAPVTTIDDGQAGYAETGTGWVQYNRPSAFQGTARRHAPGGGADTAAWTFSGLAPGWYTVQVTWPTGRRQASNAPYTVYDGGTSRGAVTVDQTTAPSQTVFQGQAWDNLGTFSVASGTLSVVLSDYADGRVVADAVHLVPVQNVVQVLSLTRSLSDPTVTAQVSVTVQVPQ